MRNVAILGISRAHPLAVHSDGELLKGLNTIHLAPKAPLVNKPRRASAELLFQAQRKINKGVNRKTVLGQLQTSTARKAATVVSPPPMAPPLAGAPAPNAATGFGGAGYSGNVAGQIGHAVNPGTTTDPMLRPAPVT